MTRTKGAILWIGLGLVLSVTRTAPAQFDELARRVPSTANAIVLVDAEKVYASPAAAQGDWKANREKAWESGMTLLPPAARHAVLAVQLDLRGMITLWEVALMDLEHEPSLEKLAQISAGAMDKIGPYTSVQMSGDSYVVNFGKRVVGAIAPGNRQLVGRWIRETDSRRSMALSPYLTEAYHFANDLGTPVIMAIDLEDVTSPDEVQAGLDSMPAEIGLRGVNLRQLAEPLSSIRGITLGVTLRAEPYGKIKVDFGKELPLPAELAKKLLLHALAKRGASIDDFDSWKPAISGKQFTLEGNLSQVGIRRLSSLFNRPPAVPHEGVEIKAAPEQSPGDTEAMRTTTKKYFADFSRLLGDLSEKPSSEGTKTMGQVGVWCERYAAKIEKLPTLNVDPELLDFSAQVCSSLRRVHSTIQEGARQGNAASRAVTPQYNYYSFGETYGYTYAWPWGGMNPVGSYGTVAVPDMRQYYNDKSRAQYESNSKATFDVRQVGQQIRAAVSDMRRKMTEKYKTQF